MLMENTFNLNILKKKKSSSYYAGGEGCAFFPKIWQKVVDSKMYKGVRICLLAV